MCCIYTIQTSATSDLATRADTPEESVEVVNMKPSEESHKDSGLTQDPPPSYSQSTKYASVAVTLSAIQTTV